MNVYLYIDPGTGSMLFTILLGVITAGIYGLRSMFIKMRFRLSGGKQTMDENSIPYVIFSDSKRYWNIFEPICNAFEARGERVRYMTASPDDPALEKSYEHVTCEFIGEGNKAFARLNMLHADLLLSTTPSLDVFQWKRSKDVKYYVHILHAASDVTLYRMFGIDYYDAMLLSGEYQITQLRALEKVRKLPEKEMELVGCVPLDELKRRLDEVRREPQERTTVLLAPSWGKSAILQTYGGKIIDALLETGYHVIIRPHPQSFTSEKELMDQLMRDYPESDRLEWNRDNDNFEVLLRSDILISDFSGVVFDFALVFDKPIIYADTSFDMAPYDACWLEEEPWTFRVLPTIGEQLKAEDLPKIKELIDTCLTDVKYKEGRDRARAESWCNIGNAAESTVEYLMRKRTELLEKQSD